MAWRLKMKARKAPPGMELVRERLEEFESETREALNTPADDKRRNEITWPMHKLHYRKNRYLYEMHYKKREISKQLLDYLIHEKIADGKLISKWRRPGYETVCSLVAITKLNTNYKSVNICRVPLAQRKGQILPNVLTGCVTCASGDNGPVWWDDPVPEFVKQRAAQVDPGKASLLQIGAPADSAQHEGKEGDGDTVEERVRVDEERGVIEPGTSGALRDEDGGQHESVEERDGDGNPEEEGARVDEEHGAIEPGTSDATKDKDEKHRDSVEER